MRVILLLCVLLVGHLRTSRKRGSHPERTHGSWSPNNPFDSKRARALKGGLTARKKKAGDDAKAKAAAKGRKLAGPKSIDMVGGGKATYDPATKTARIPNSAIDLNKKKKSRTNIKAIEKAFPDVEFVENDNGAKLPFDGLKRHLGLAKPEPPKEAPKPEPKTRAPSTPRAPRKPPGEAEFTAPAGSVAPVSRAMKVPNTKTFKPARDAIEAIDKVHDDGDLKEMPIAGGLRAAGVQGEYYPSASRPRIKLRGAGATSPRLTTAHEIGHALDHQVLGNTPGKFATRGNDSEVYPVLGALEGTKAVKKLNDMKRNPDEYATSVKAPITGREYRYPPDRRHLAYMTTDEELFARGYAQYIAEKSGDPEMKKELGRIVEQSKPKHAYPYQWEESDFAPVRKAFDKMFADRGWLKE